MNDNLIDLENKSKFGKSEILLICCIIFQLTVSLMPFHYGDGYFRDELYFIAMSNHIGWGYVDVPPLVPFILSIVRSIFGTSLFSIHLFPAIIGSVILMLNYRIVKIFGGGFFASLLTLLPTTLMAIGIGSLFNYDSFNWLFWNLMLFTLIKIITSENRKKWIYFGIFAGLGLLSKITIVLLGSGIVAGLILTKERKYFRSVYFWSAGLIALLIFSPYLIWNYSNNFPTFEFFSNYASGKVIPLSATYFITQQFLMPPLIPLWFCGIYFLFFNKYGKNFRILGIAYIIILLECIITNQKPYIPQPYLPLIFAGGAVVIEAALTKHKLLHYLRILYVIIIVAFCFYALPETRPILPLKTYIKYYPNSGVNIEGHKKGLLKQYYADRFGWKSLTEKVANIYNSLPTDQRAKTAIFAADYGEAGAIELFGKKFGLPRPICGQNQYYLWGPRDYTDNIMIIVWPDPYLHLLKPFLNEFKYVKIMDRTKNKYCMEYENNMPIILCKDPKQKPFPLKKIWSQFKYYQ